MGCCEGRENHTLISEVKNDSDVSGEIDPIKEWEFTIGENNFLLRGESKKRFKIIDIIINLGNLWLTVYNYHRSPPLSPFCIF